MRRFLAGQVIQELPKRRASETESQVADRVSRGNRFKGSQAKRDAVRFDLAVDREEARRQEGRRAWAGAAPAESMPDGLKGSEVTPCGSRQ